MEKPPSFWERRLGMRTPHLRFVRAALCEQARADNLVLHGQIGHLLLPDLSHIIRVRVIADMEFRIKAAIQQQNLGDKEALAYIREVDRARRQWVRLLFDLEWDDPHLYDVVLNLSRMRLATACETMAHLTDRHEFKPTGKSLQTMQDLALASHVSAVLASNTTTKEAALHVVAADGIVTITGRAECAAVVKAVPFVVRQVTRVKEVRSEITIHPSPYDPCGP